MREQVAAMADKIGQLADAQGGKTGWTQTEKLPQMPCHRRQVVGTAHIAVFLLQLSRVLVMESAFQQSGLPHHYRFYMEGAVLDFGEIAHRSEFGQQFEGKADE